MKYENEIYIPMERELWIKRTTFEVHMKAFGFFVKWSQLQIGAHTPEESGEVAREWYKCFSKSRYA